MMKLPMLILLPLLAACAPALTGTSNPTPFKTGQTWRVSSTSALDAKLPASTEFTVSDVVSDSGDWSVKTRTGSNSPVDLYYVDDPGFALLFDEASLDADASRLRFCALNMSVAGGSYSGYAAHPLALKFVLNKDSDFKDALGKALDKNANKTSTTSLGSYRNLLYKSIAEAVDDTDNAPCTLELVK
ncbi:hypothetical protein [Deinococcus sp.]|uniref:hypothetical protein n=1 Tax=Deinococcus sp. TaxID=47478 RepID=UPI003CC510FD